MNNKSNKYWPLLICLTLALATLAVFAQVHNFDFVKYDDDTYVTDNRHVQSPFSRQAVRWAFTTGCASNWHPLTWLSHMLDCQLFGLDARGHHLMNLFFHTVNTLLLFAVLKRMTTALWPSAFVAALFALHPLHIESVAWVAERKDVLSSFFWFLTMWSYIRYAERRCAARYISTLVFFVLGLMAKPMLVTLPFVLLLLDYWPLGRLQRPVLHVVAEKLPFFAFSAVSSAITFLIQRSGGAMAAFEVYSVKTRIANTVVSYANYITDMLWPSRLAVLYPHPGSGIPIAKVIICVLGLLFISICFIYVGRRHRYLTFGWLWYLGTLIPVIGLVQVGAQARADRYTYIPLTGLFIIIAWGVRELTNRLPYRKIILTVSSSVVLCALAVCTWGQLGYWKNSVTLFERTLDVTSNNYIMHNNYANILFELNRIEEAVEHYNRSLELKPNFAKIHNNLGNALAKLDRSEEAINHYNQALNLKPDYAVAHYNLARALAGAGKNDQAIAEYRTALQFKPDYIEALSNLGFELAKQGNFEQAVEYYNKTIELDQQNIIAHGRLALALAAVGKTNEAIKQCRIVLAARPYDVEMYRNLGILLEQQGKSAEAIEQYRKALKVNPDDSKTRNLLQAALAKKNNK